jgi:exopolysaccharide biosynthesis polyprenyl glycosylphosphotransferase
MGKPAVEADTTCWRATGEREVSLAELIIGDVEPVRVKARVVEIHHRPAPVGRPWWIRTADDVHGCKRAAAAVVVDAAVMAAGGLVAGLGAPVAAAVVVVLLAVFNVGGVYRARTTLETQGILWYPTTIAAPLAFATLALAGIAEAGTGTAMSMLQAAAVVAVLLLLVRVAAWCLVSSIRRRGIGLRAAVVVGSGDAARTVVRKLNEFPEAGLRPVGILAPDGHREEGMGVGTGALPADLPSLIVCEGISHVVLVPEGNHDIGIADCLELCDGLDVSFSMLPPLADLYLRPALVSQVGGLPLISLGKITRSRSTLPGKRALDLVCAGLLLLVTLPVMLATAVAIKLGDGGPVLYRQRRVGQGGREFFMLKFRSMVVGADRLVDDLVDLNLTDGLLFKVAHDPRVTRVGAIIRRLSIDELPQLINVLRGEMSVVGPRPLPVDPDDFGTLDGKRHSVPPGITGYWQIAGGTGLTYQEMVKLDLSYIQNWSLWVDLRLLARTVPALLTRHRHGTT